MSRPQQLGLELQRDPYKYLLTEHEKESAKNMPMRVISGMVAAKGAAFYYLSRHQQLGRVRALSISFDMVFGCAWRMLLAFAIADQAARRFFVNYSALQ